ncbi:MAG: ABC transporter permease subunit [Candidatus Cloacimonetes bacterium]|nr:ABC transporter permease subunit [Candidatus Cloacimonadota bacterium]MCF7814800.1 ABC transporter permease subunit [Candidatus Cloacimonadota bacterium]MCF7869205.1 ABC transporter permease subunit [Candidatus Cloacimonadota bacterium]MCF7884632.1 ABC transporter permease subunit [Candidatus Cloacimonadota bacterium]
MKRNLNFLGIIFVLLLLILLSISLKIDWQDWQELQFSFKALITDLVISFLRVLLTSLVAWIMGIICGYFIFYLRFCRQLFLPAINFIRHISPFAWLPFAIIWFGLGEASVSFIMFITLFFPTVIAASDQFNSIPHEFIDEAKVLGTSQFQLFKFVELPLSFVGFLNLFRIIWGLGWTVIIAAEMLGVNSGLGFRLLDFRYLLQYPQMLIYFVVMGSVGILFDWMLRKIVVRFEM